MFCCRRLLVTSVYCAKTAEAIQMLFDVVGRLGPRNRVLDGRAHQCHLANTVERLCAAPMSVSATRPVSKMPLSYCVSAEHAMPECRRCWQAPSLLPLYVDRLSISRAGSAVVG